MDSSSSEQTLSGLAPLPQAGMTYFEDHMNEIAGLQADLQQVNNLCFTQRNELLAMRRNYDELKEELLHVREQLRVARLECDQAVLQREEVEGLHERLCRELRAQLEQKEAELAQMAAMNAVPRDLHMLRIRVQEELEAPHAQRVAELESRVEYFSADAFDLRSKLEVMKLEYDRTVEERGKDAEEFQRELRRERETLQHHISELQRRLDAQAVDDLPRKLERVKAQLELSEKQWAEENHTLRAACQSAKSALQEKREEHKRDVAHLRTQLAALDAEKANADRLLRGAEAEIVRLSGALKEAQLRQHALQAAVTHSATQVAALAEAGASAAVGGGGGGGGDDTRLESKLHDAERQIRSLEMALHRQSEARFQDSAWRGGEQGSPVRDVSENDDPRWTSVRRERATEEPSMQRTVSELQQKNRLLQEKVVKFYRHYVKKQAQLDALKAHKVVCSAAASGRKRSGSVGAATFTATATRQTRDRSSRDRDRDRDYDRDRDRDRDRVRGDPVSGVGGGRGDGGALGDSGDLPPSTPQ